VVGRKDFTVQSSRWQQVAFADFIMRTYIIFRSQGMIGRSNTFEVSDSYSPKRPYPTSTVSPELNNHVQTDVNYASTPNLSHKSDPTVTSSFSGPLHESMHLCVVLHV
jgi:hypothetical protein